jgi:hypothetical protein
LFNQVKKQKQSPFKTLSFLIGLKKLVLHSLNFNYWMKMAMSLPFVPPNYVLDVFNNILLEFLENQKDTEECQVHNVHTVVSCYECEFFIYQNF